MPIVYYGLSLQGVDHVRDNIPCQDANETRIVKNGWIVSAVADGLGSCSHSDIGAKIAVKKSIDFIEEGVKELKNWNEIILKAIVVMSFKESLKQIYRQASLDKLSIKDYQTTLSLVIYDGKNIVYGHTGDGGIIVLPKQGDHFLLAKPQKGEEANATYPLSHINWDIGGYKSNDNPIVSVLLATDGILEGLFLPISGNRKMFHYNCSLFMNNHKLKITQQSEMEKKKIQIEQLFSNRYKSITDDKTISVILNTEIEPQIPNYPNSINEIKDSNYIDSDSKKDNKNIVDEQKQNNNNISTNKKEDNIKLKEEVEENYNNEIITKIKELKILSIFMIVCLVLLIIIICFK